MLGRVADAGLKRRFWRQHSLYVLDRDQLLDRQSALETRLANGQRELDKLQRTNVYSESAADDHVRKRIAHLNGPRHFSQTTPSASARKQASVQSTVCASVVCQESSFVCPFLLPISFWLNPLSRPGRMARDQCRMGPYTPPTAHHRAQVCVRVPGVQARAVREFLEYREGRGERRDGRGVRAVRAVALPSLSLACAVGSADSNFRARTQLRVRRLCRHPSPPEPSLRHGHGRVPRMFEAVERVGHEARSGSQAAACVSREISLLRKVARGTRSAPLGDSRGSVRLRPFSGTEPIRLVRTVS